MTIIHIKVKSLYGFDPHVRGFISIGYEKPQVFEVVHKSLAKNVLHLEDESGENMEFFVREVSSLNV